MIQRRDREPPGLARKENVVEEPEEGNRRFSGRHEPPGPDRGARGRVFLGRDVTIGGETLGKLSHFAINMEITHSARTPDSRRPWPTLVAPAFGERFCRELRHLLRAVVESSGPPSQDRVSADNWLNQFNPARAMSGSDSSSRVRGGTPSWACPLAGEEVLLIGEPLRRTFVAGKIIQRFR